MAIDLFPLLKRLQVGCYDNCVILTYTADLNFYEQVVWPILRSRGCYNNLVMMDSRQYVTALDTTGMILHRLGKSYSVWPVPAAKSFHPKIILQTNEKEGRLIIGSGNLTVRGFSTNWELFSEIASTAGSGMDRIFAETWRMITESAQRATKAVRRQLEQMSKTSGTVLSSEGGENWPCLLFATPNQPSLIKQLKSLVGNTPVRRVIIVSPFFDPRLQALKEFEKVFRVKDIIAVVQQETVSFPGNAAKTAKALAVHEFVAPHSGKSGYLHAKAYIIQTANTEYCVWGSANCSMAAIGGQGNYEAVLVTKGKLGSGIATLGLGPSITKGHKINPGKLKLSGKKSPLTEEALSVASAEVDRGEISVVIAHTTRFSECTEGRLKLWSEGAPIGDLKLRRTDSTTFIGRLNHNKCSGSVICRLILQDEDGELVSTPVAVNFLEDLEEATPTRHLASMCRVIEAIHSGTFEWAKGLERVCELVIKIGLHDAETATSKDVTRRAQGHLKTAAPEGVVKVGEYEDFISDIEDESREAKEIQTRSLLEDVVAALRAQILRGITKDAVDEDGIRDLDLSRYREEAERETAESGEAEYSELQSGDSERKDDIPDLEGLEKEYRRVQRAYVRLMQGLARRYEWFRDNGGTIGAEEFWRLDAVNLLLLDGCQRTVTQAHNLGPVIVPEDIMHEYLPAIAVFLGRIRAIKSSDHRNGPLLDWARIDLSDIKIVAAVRSTCALLAGLVAHWRPNKYPDLAEWPHYTQVTAARCLASLLRKNLLPTHEELADTISRSTWLKDFECSRLVEVFNRLCRFARIIVRYEDQFDASQLLPSPQSLRPGDWVCAASCGVTEVVRLSGPSVQIALIGQGDTDEEWYLKVRSECLQRVNVPIRHRKQKLENPVEELDDLIPYSDQDYDDWRDVIMPRLHNAHFPSLVRISKGAQSSQLRSEASTLIIQHPPVTLSEPTSDPKVEILRQPISEPVKGMPIILTCNDRYFQEYRTTILKNLQRQSQSNLNTLSQSAASYMVRYVASRLLEGKSPLPPKPGRQPLPTLWKSGMPPQFALVKHVRKVREGEKWVLKTKRNVPIKTFDTEGELDRFWHDFQIERESNYP